MRAIGKQLNISPIKLEHYVNGYFSTLGMMVLTPVDAVVRAAGGYPARPAGGPNPFLLGVVNKKYSSNKYVDRFYDFYGEVDTAYRTFRHLAKTGQADEAKAFARDNAELLSGSLRKTTNKIRGYLSDINQKIKMVQRDKTMTPKEKREIIDLLNDRKKQVTKALFEQVRAK
jgi:hypothetical protein